MKKQKQILAWIVIIVLLGLYLATFIFSLIGTSWAFDMFKLCVGATFLLPVLLYGLMLLGRLSRTEDKSQEASSDASTKNKTNRRKS